MPSALGLRTAKRRARTALLQAGATRTPERLSAVKRVDALGYAVLYGTEGTLAVYRIRPDTLLLRRMKRWPAVLDNP